MTKLWSSLTDPQKIESLCRCITQQGELIADLQKQVQKLIAAQNDTAAHLDKQIGQINLNQRRIDQRFVELEKLAGLANSKTYFMAQRRGPN